MAESKQAGLIDVDTVCSEMARIAPLSLAESWDNVGLLVGNRRQVVRRVMTCLTLSPTVVNEAIDRGVDLVVSHHPLPFKPLAKLTDDTITASLLLQLIRGNVAVYSAHTAFDSASTGINQTWAEMLELSDVRPLVDFVSAAAPVPQREKLAASTIGSGRMGELRDSMSLQSLASRAASLVGAKGPRWVGAGDQRVSRVAVACGSGGSFLAAAKGRGCDALITGEATFHTCLEAESLGIGLVLLGHYHSERFAMESLACRLGQAFPDVEAWASERERDPIQSGP